MKDFTKKHTYVICAYKESPYLEECIKSVLNQTVKSTVLMVTATPNDYIENLSKKYGIPLKVNKGETGIVQDWNFGYNACNTQYVTIAHQDDIYFPNYAEEAVGMLEKSNKPLIYFTDYCEIRNGIKIKTNQLLKIKRIMLAPLKIKRLQKSRLIRRRILAFGDAISCPTVTYAVNNLPNPVFRVHFRSCEDWEAWERISKIKGDFLYNSKICMGHRIHEGSETSIIIGDNARKKEDYEMFCKFWPKTIARIIASFYAKSEKSNNI